MIISKEDFKELGFTYDAQNEELLESCIKRAEHILNAMCGGALASAMAQSRGNASLIRQAAAFEADALLKAELSAQRTEFGESSMTRVSIGDLSYTESGFNGSSGSSQSSPFDVSQTVRKLLCAAGCYPYTAAEVVE